MEIFLAIVFFLSLMLASALLFAASGSLRSCVRELLPAHESKIFLPAGDWYMPQNAFGNLRPIAIFRKQPSALMSAPSFRATLAQVRFLAAFSLFGLVAILVYWLAA